MFSGASGRHRINTRFDISSLRSGIELERKLENVETKNSYDYMTDPNITKL
jgi:hypothetical protein